MTRGDEPLSSGRSSGDPDAARLAAVVSPLRRAILSATREAGDLPSIPDAQIQLIRALPGGEPRSPSELATELRLDRSTISNLLAAMQRAGLVERRGDPADRRRSLVTTSARARELFSAFDRSSAELLQRAIDTLGAGDRSAIAAAQPALERLLDALHSAPSNAADAAAAAAADRS